MDRKIYHCNTTRPGYTEAADKLLVQDGYIETYDTRLIPQYKYIENRMSRDCKYDRIEIDPQCFGCKRGQEALEEKRRKEREQWTGVNICERDDYFSVFLRESIEKSINQKTEEKKKGWDVLDVVRRRLSKT